MEDGQRPAAMPRVATSRRPQPTGKVLLDEVAAILGAGIARVVEADAVRQADASGVGIELAINRGSRLTVRPAARDGGDGGTRP